MAASFFFIEGKFIFNSITGQNGKIRYRLS